MSRALWFAAGAGAGVYGVIRGRRAAEAFTAEGLHDRMNALFLGARMFREEFHQGRTDSEADLRHRIELAEARHRELTSGARPAIEGSETEKGND